MNNLSLTLDAPDWGFQYEMLGSLFPNLECLRIINAQNLHGRLAFLAEHPNLRVLDIRNCPDFDPNSFSTFGPKLTALNVVHQPRINGEHLTPLFNLCVLHTVAVPFNIGTFKRLVRLSIHEKINSRQLQQIQKLKGLKNLYLANASGLKDQDIEFLSKNLKKLTLCYPSQLSPEAIQSIAKIQTLEEVNFKHWNQIKEKDISLLMKSSNVQSVHTYECEKIKSVESIQLNRSVNASS